MNKLPCGYSLIHLVGYCTTVQTSVCSFIKITFTDFKGLVLLLAWHIWFRDLQYLGVIGSISRCREAEEHLGEGGQSSSPLSKQWNQSFKQRLGCPLVFQLTFEIWGQMLYGNGTTSWHSITPMGISDQNFRGNADGPMSIDKLPYEKMAKLATFFFFFV